MPDFRLPTDFRKSLASIRKIEALVAIAGTDLRRVRGRVVHAFRLAVETAMRSGEIPALGRADITGAVARLDMTRNGLPRDRFQLKFAGRDTMFRRLRAAAKIEGLTFHDAWHEAIARLAQQLDGLALACMVGHVAAPPLRAIAPAQPGLRLRC